MPSYSEAYDKLKQRLTECLAKYNISLPAGVSDDFIRTFIVVHIKPNIDQLDDKAKLLFPQEYERMNDNDKKIVHLCLQGMCECLA